MPLKLLTWNIQAAIGTARFSDYLTRAHRQVFHTPAKADTLETIAETLREADLVDPQPVSLVGCARPETAGPCAGARLPDRDGGGGDPV